MLKASQSHERWDHPDSSKLPSGITSGVINGGWQHRHKGVERLSCSAYLIRKVLKNRKFLEDFLQT